MLETGKNDFSLSLLVLHIIHLEKILGFSIRNLGPRFLCVFLALIVEKTVIVAC